VQRIIVRRVAIALAVLFVCAALLFAWASTPAHVQVGPVVEPSPQAALYEQRCARCHEPDEMLQWLGERDETDPGGALLEFLYRHGKASGRENRAITVHLESLMPLPRR
jgi:hypothetical protein